LPPAVPATIEDAFWSPYFWVIHIYGLIYIALIDNASFELNASLAYGGFEALLIVPPVSRAITGAINGQALPAFDIAKPVMDIVLPCSWNQLTLPEILFDNDE
jgi:hypothetical protein